MQNLRGSTTTRCPPCVRLPRIQRTHVSSEHDSGSRDILTGFVTRTERSEHGLWLVSGTAIFGNMDASDGLGVVPAHTYARLRFDEAAEQAVTHLGYVLQMHQGSPYQGQFVAQSEQRAGMGCSPPHIALLSGLQGTNMTGRQIQEALTRLAMQFGPVQGRLLPRCKVTQNGCVLLGVDSPDSLRMAVALSQMLPGADAYYATQRPEQQHLTLGRFGGTDAAGFAAWLSESLLGQNALLPTFTGSHVQLSDEARPFSNVPVALTGGAGAGATGHGGGFGNGGLGNGNGLRQGGVPLGGFAPVGGGAGFDTPIGGAVGRGAVGAERPELPRGAGGLVEARKPAAPVPSGNSLSNNSRPRPSPAAIGIAGGVATPAQAQPASYASAMKVPVSLAAPIPGPSRETTTAAAQSSEALLEMLQTSCVGAEGVGVICNSASVSGGFVLRPQEQAAWTLRLAPLVQNLRDVLSSVGALRFCQMIDGVANPHDWSLAIECQPNLARGATLEMVQDQTICAQIEANAVAASNTGAQVRLVAVAVDQKKIGAPGHNDTGSPVMLCRSEHVVDNGTGLTRVASFALHLEPVSGLNSADPPYLSLTFAWLGARWPLASVGDGAEARVANPVPPPMTSGAAGNNANPGPRRPGDWTCVGCAAHNFASRSVCFKCKNGKPIGVPSGGSRGYGEFGGKPVSFPASEPSPGAGAQPVGGSFRPGDWICAGCRAHNFASRGNCFKCKQRKAGAVSEPSAGTEPPAPQAGGGGSLQTASDNFRSGDWLCQNCRAHNFASRGSCFKCSSKPSSS